jgi:hypothetical protein
VVWLAAGLLFLLLWPTKWPQYTLILTPALCLSAVSSLQAAYRWVKEKESYWPWLRIMVMRPHASFWAFTGLIVVGFAVGYTAVSLQRARGRIGWYHYSTHNTELPDGTVYDIVPISGTELGLASDVGMALGTDRGAALYLPPADASLRDEWLVFTADNSGLSGDRVRVIAQDLDGALWFGTAHGVARYDGAGWEAYGADEIGLSEPDVYSLAVGTDGLLWAGTRSGLAAWDGVSWVTHTSVDSGLADDWVRAIAVEPQPAGDQVWLGTQTALSRLDTATGQWTNHSQDFQVTVLSLLIDSSGKLWVGTMGAGLGVLDADTSAGTADGDGPAAGAKRPALEEKGWRFYRTRNSDIPFNTVRTIAEIEPGVLWVGSAPSEAAGGALAEFDGKVWTTLDERNSGFSGAEPLTITQDASGNWWVGSRLLGIDIYQPQR